MSRNRPNSCAREADVTRREIKDRWGCKRYVRPKRCPKCGHKNFIRRPDSAVCLHCVMRRLSESL